MDAKTKLWTALFVVALVCLAIIGVVYQNNVKLEKANRVAAMEKAQLEAKAKELAQLKAEVEKKLEVSQEEKTLLESTTNGLKTTVEEQEKYINNLETKLEEETPSEPVGSSFAYVLDDLTLGDNVDDFILSGNKIVKLLDKEVEFDGDTYDMEESVEFSGLRVAVGSEDFKGEARLEVDEDGIFYKVTFDSALPTSDIGVDDEYLTFEFLGEEVVVKEWDGTKLVLTMGNEFTLREGEKVLVDGKELEVKFISENEQVNIKVGDETKTIAEGQKKTIGGVEVYVDSVLINSREGLVVLKAGTDVQETIHSGDEYSDGSVWEWYIDEANKVIGLELVEAFKGFDEDEDYNSFAYGEGFGLPKDRVTITFIGLDKVESQDLVMDLASKSSVEYVRLKGEFELGVEKYDRLYISKTTAEIFGLDENNDLELLGDEVELKGSDFTVKVTPTEVHILDKVGSIRAVFDKAFAFSMLDLEILDGDENHLGSSGIRVSNVEDALEDEVFKFSVPEEVVLASIGFN